MVDEKKKVMHATGGFAATEKALLKKNKILVI
jgi:hypothetical protein